MSKVAQAAVHKGQSVVGLQAYLDRRTELLSPNIDHCSQCHVERKGIVMPRFTVVRERSGSMLETLRRLPPQSYNPVD